LTNVLDKSFFITRLRKGGAIDRSVKDEDYRTVLGYDYELRQAVPESMLMYITKPEYDPDGNLILGVYLNPSYLLGHAASVGVDLIQFSFGYDTTHFEPLMDPTSATHLEILLPSERIPGKLGWSAFKSLNGATTVPNAAGTNICIQYDGSLLAPQAWNTAPFLNLIARNRNPLCFIKLTPTFVQQDTNSYGLFHNQLLPEQHVLNIVQDNGGSEPVTHDAGLIAWQEAVRTDLAGGYTWSKTQPGERTRDDYTFMSQSINWVYKAPEVGSGETQIRTRGIYSQIGSQGVVPQTDAWPWGQYNAGFAADRKEYSGQIIDNSAQANNTFALTTVANKDPLRNRLYDSTSGIMDERVFSGSARFGSDVNDFDGNFLIDESQYDTISMSQSTRGEMVTVTMFGFIRDKAEALVIGGLKLVYKVVAGRRRRGR